METVTPALVQQIEQWMAREGLNQEDAAKVVGVSQSTISRWLEGVIPKGQSRQRLAEAMGIAPERFIQLAPEPAGSPTGDVVSAFDTLGNQLGVLGEAVTRTVAGEADERNRAILALAIEGMLEDVDGLSQCLRRALKSLE